METTNVVIDAQEKAQLEISSKETSELNALELALVGGGFGDVTAI